MQQPTEKPLKGNVEHCGVSVSKSLPLTSEVSDDSTQAMKIVMLEEKNLSWN